MLDEKTPLMAWIPTSMLLPKDGEPVFVVGRYDPSPRAVVFRRSPAARWENGNTVYQFGRFDQWAPVSPDARN